MKISLYIGPERITARIRLLNLDIKSVYFLQGSKTGKMVKIQIIKMALLATPFPVFRYCLCLYQRKSKVNIQVQKLQFLIKRNHESNIVTFS